MSELTTARTRGARGAARARRRARGERAEQIARARRGARRGAGAGLLARPLAARPQRADAQAGRRRVPRGGARSRARSCAGAKAAKRKLLRMSGGVSVVIPVKDGARYLEEVLAAVLAPGAGPRGAGHRLGLARRLAGDRAGGRRRACSRSSPARSATGAPATSARSARAGELICFLTQDATPLPGWLAAFREALALEERVGAAFGPHLPRPDTSPMIARELTEFFAGFAPDGRPALQRAGGEPFLSNVNACYRRACWEAIRFDDIALLRGPGLRPRDARGGLGEGLPPRRGGAPCARLPAGRLHAPLLRRVPRAARVLGPRRAVRAALDASATSARSSPPTGAGCASRASGRADARALDRRARSSTTPGRKVFSALGSRADKLPAARRSGRSRSSGARRRSRGRRVAGAGARAPRRARARRLRRRHARRCARARRRCSTPCPGWRTRSGCTSPS